MGKFKKNTNLDKKLFLWGVVETDVSIGGLLKKKSGSGRKWDERYIVVSRNYIIYYKAVNDDGTPKQIDYPRGIINLGTVLNTDIQLAPDQDAKGLAFQVPTTSRRVYYFKAKEDKAVDKWIRLIKDRSTALTGIRVEELGNVAQSITTIQAMFPRNITFPERVPADQIDRFIDQTKKYQTSLQQWEPFMRKCSLFLEYYFGPNRSYIDWFLSVDGPRTYLQRSEEQVIANWISHIERTVKEASFAGKTRFFREDLEETAQTCEAAILMIDGLNKYRREFLKDAVFVELHLKEKEIFRKLADGYRTLPSERSIDFRTYKGGTITGGKSEWTFGTQHGQPTLKGEVEGISMQYTAQGPELQSPVHGAVIWNGKTWVWYHPRTVFSIRYDWESKTGTFHQKTHQLEDTPMRKVDYPDWALQGAALKCQAKRGDSVPPVLTWEVSGSVPVPAALLAAMSSLILEAMRIENIPVK